MLLRFAWKGKKSKSVSRIKAALPLQFRVGQTVTVPPAVALIRRNETDF